MLLAADWSRQLFDLGQIRTVRYPLSEGDVTEPTVQAFHDAIKDAIQKLASGVSPMHASIRGFPFNVDEQTASSMKDQMMDLNDLESSIGQVEDNERRVRLVAVIATFKHA